MARLPTKYDISPVGNLASNRPMAQVDLGGEARGLQQAGAGLQNLGSSITQIGAQQAKQDRLIQGTQAETDLATDRAAREEALRNDTDYGTLTQRWAKDDGAAIQRAALRIKDPKTRELFTLEQQKSGLGYNKRLSAVADAGIKDGRIATLETAWQKSHDLIANPATPDDVRTRTKTELDASIAEGAKAGVFSEQYANDLRRKYVDGADYALAGSLVKTPDGNRAVLPQVQVAVSQSGREAQAMSYFIGRGYSKAQAAGIVGNLIHESAGLKTSIKNPGDGADGSDSIGIGQWNGPRAKALKAFAASHGKDWHDYGVQLAFVDHELNTNYGGVKARLLAAKSSDDAAGVIVTGYERPAGSQNGAVASHGWSNRRDQARRLAGGEFNPNDVKTVSAEGTAPAPPDNYATAYQNLRSRFPNLSAEQIDNLATSAVTAKNGFAVQDRAAVEQAVQDGPSALANTGRYDGPTLDRGKFQEVYGQEGERRFNAYDAAMKTAKSTFDMQTQSSADIMAQVEAARTLVQNTTGEGADLADKRLNALQTAAAATIAAREKDPAGYVQQAFPVVKQAWAAYAGNPGDQQAFSNALTATSAAQQQLGIAPEKQRILPDSIADGIVEKLKMKDLEPSKALVTLGQAVFATNDPLQQEAIFDQLKKAGVPAEAEGAIRALHQGRTGDARFLMEAATAKDVPWGTGDEKPGAINDAIAAAMSSGSPAGVLYGLDAGSTDNLDRYQADRNLFTNAVKLKMLGGKNSAAAITEVQKALYGGARVVDQGHVKLTLPEGVDADKIVTGLGAQLPTVKAALEQWGMVTPAGASPAQKREAQFQSWDRAARINDIATNTGIWRNLGNGYGFMDATTGLFVAGKDGKPLVVTDDDLAAAAKVQANAVAVQEKADAVEAAKPITAIPLGASGESIQLTPAEVQAQNPTAPAPAAPPVAPAPKAAAVDEKPNPATTAVDKAPTAEPFNPKDHVSLGEALKPYSKDAVHIAKAAWKFLHPPEPGPIDWKEMQKAIDPWMPASPVAQDKVLQILELQDMPAGQRHVPGFNKGHDDPLLRRRMRPKDGAK